MGRGVPDQGLEWINAIALGHSPSTGAGGEQQAARLAALRERRDSERVSTLLARLEEAARGSDNLMPVILECVEAYGTLGEICGVLREVFGEYRPTMAI